MKVIGEPYKKKKPSRGLRQGVFSYLFFLCMERLGHILNEAVNEGRWKPIRLSRKALLHLFFADDLLLFGEASVDQMS